MPFALIAAAAIATSLPCERAEPADIKALIGGPAVPVPSEEMGEETAPGCMWSTRHREREVKLTVWSKDELPVLDLPDAIAYFEKLISEARASGSAENLPSLGSRAFISSFKSKPGQETQGQIVVLKEDRLFVFDFMRTTRGPERAFVAN